MIIFINIVKYNNYKDYASEDCIKTCASDWSKDLLYTNVRVEPVVNLNMIKQSSFNQF